jgi:ribosome-associated translation inhibitor RaiA
MTGKGEDLYTDSLYDLSLEEKIRQLERQSSYERLARLELSVENERLRGVVVDQSIRLATFKQADEEWRGGYSRITSELTAARAELSDLYPAIEGLRDELQRAKAEGG